jgi:hypothetical protein
MSTVDSNGRITEVTLDETLGVTRFSQIAGPRLKSVLFQEDSESITYVSNRGLSSFGLLFDKAHHTGIVWEGAR